MKRRLWLAGALLILLWGTPAKADNGFIVRSTLSAQALQTACNPPLLSSICTVVRGLGDPLGQLFLITSPLDLSGLLNLVGNPLGIVDAEVDQLLNLVGGLNVIPTGALTPTLMSDRTPVVYPAGSSTMAWNSYVNQPAASVVEIQNAQNQFHTTGTGTVADIDTGVDPNHPVLQGVLLPGYDFTRNQTGGSEMTDVASGTLSCTPTTCPSAPSAVQVNQSSAAILDQSSAAILDTSQYSAFGHGTMVMGIIHLVAPTAKLLPLKAFKSDGTANLSDILRAIYFAAQNGANVINMSFDTKTSSAELKNALDYANQQGLISAASAGNDGVAETVYPAALQSDVMGVASVGSTSSTEGTRSSFSNFGNSIVWVAAPGEQIVTTYPYNSYAAGWGTSFSAPFVSGGAALLRNLSTTINQSGAASAVAHAVLLNDPGMDNGRLDLVPALESISGGGGTPDYTVSPSPSSQSIAAGGTANFTVTATPQAGFNQTVTWSCSGAPMAATCSVTPSTVTLDGTHAVTATVSLKTTARGSAPPPILPPVVPPEDLWILWAAGFAWLVVFLLVCKFGATARLRPSLVATAGLLAAVLFTYSCGGYGNGGGSGSLTLTSLTLTPSSVTGGSSSTGTVTLSGPAPYAGANVSVSSNMSAATVPPTVTVAPGTTIQPFTVNTTAVTSSTSVTITATLGTSTQTVTLTVTPAGTAPTLSSIALNPSSVTGGSSSTGTVTLTGPAPSNGAVVSLSSGASAATVPASVTIAAGATSATFMANTTSVTNSTPVTITASYGGATKTATLTVTPAGTAPTLSSITVNPSSVTGGSFSTGTVTLSGPAPSSGAAVNLSSGAAAATVPASVTVAAGAASATFTVNTTAVTSSTSVTITATLGTSTKTATLTVTPAGTSPTLSSIALNPSSVTGGSSSTGTVTLSGPAPSNGAVVSLSSGAAAATVPASVTIASGATSATFTVSTTTVTNSTPVTITASYGGASKTATLTLTPAGTPAGTYTLTVTGTSGSLTHSSTVQVTVN